MRAFEAAARHVSFTVAAAELNVTPGAISQHIKTLEAWAGTRLFRRNAQGVVLTDAGQRLAGEFTAAFDGVARAARSLRNLNSTAEFHIAALPSVAQLWLPKRLAKVRVAFPKITFSVTALESPPDLSRELFDLAVFFEVADNTNDQLTVCEDLIVPVGAPEMCRGAFDFSAADGIRFLQDQTWEGDWQLWSSKVGLHIPNLQSGPRFSLYSLAVEEAKAGAGVLMGHLSLIEDLLTDGSLVRVHPATASTGRSLVVRLPEIQERRAETDQVARMLR